MNSVALTTATHVHGPHIDWLGLSPILALAGGALVVLLVGLFRARFIRMRLVPALTIAAFGVALGFEIARLHHQMPLIAGALMMDHLALILDMLFSVAGIAAVLLSLRSVAAGEAGHGEYHSLLLFSVLGMAVFVSAQNLVTLFIGIELLSIPLYILCASEFRREGSLESGLKYLVIGSVGSATLVYGLALVYGGTGSTDYAGIAHAVAGHVHSDSLLLTGIGLVVVGFAFKASVAPFHQWTPDVYEGAPTPITGFMATATKTAALGVFIRFFDFAVLGEHAKWAPALAVIAAITIIVGNVGALGQSSLKRMLGYSGVAQAGYVLGGVVVGTRLGIQATVLYLLFYLAMNMAAFAVIVGQEHVGEHGDDMASLAGLGARRPWLAWPMTIAMLALAGIPGTVGFIGKFQLIHAMVAGGYTWLAIVLVVGSMISLGYYLRVIATMWMGSGVVSRGLGGVGGVGGVGEPAPALAGGGTLPPIAGGGTLPPIAGGSPEADAGEPVHTAPGSAGSEPSGEPWSGTSGGTDQAPAAAWPSAGRIRTPEAAFVGIVFAAAAIFFGIVPSPLFHFAAHAAQSLLGLR